MAKLPRPHLPLPVLQHRDIRRVEAGTHLYRVYRAGGIHPTTWDAFRRFGPTSARFDPQLPPAAVGDRGILYAAGSLPTALAEAFGATRAIDRSREDPWLVDFLTSSGLELLDLFGDWPTRAGASQAISSGRKDHARLYAHAIYEAYPSLAGIACPSSMSGTTRMAGDPPRHGVVVALFERVAGVLPGHPTVHLPLAHPGLDSALGVIVGRFHYDLFA